MKPFEQMQIDKIDGQFMPDTVIPEEFIPRYFFLISPAFRPQAA
ncbi:MAG TPA: hypothetical protein PLJ71_21865 [Candidatus Hydrogenedentes bacterium]|nr:hypothetical protein [Candidatus Hydrogenedentota bacterium]HQM51337.1 hypothetical protein [Candidatus Hydrogenedentota bacterium]